MGGSGSGRWYRFSKKYTVDESLSLNPAQLRKLKVIIPEDYQPGSYCEIPVRWTNGSSADLVIDMTTEPPQMLLSYTFKGHGRIENKIRLSSTAQHIAGVRWWMHCPHCQRRVATLHSPRGALYFRCRQCYDLTYLKCQESHRWDSLSGRTGGAVRKLELFDKQKKLLEKLRRCHAGSKHFRRVLARIKQNEQELGVAIVFRDFNSPPDTE